LYSLGVTKSSFCSFVLFIYIALLCKIVHFEKYFYPKREGEPGVRAQVSAFLGVPHPEGPRKGEGLLI
jgi:hypothetical protein